jgi:hypothetical protein
MEVDVGVLGRGAIEAIGIPAEVFLALSTKTG